MTLDRTPMNAPDVPVHQHKPGQCSAYGCPMWAGIKTGGEWLCDCHAFADVTHWQQVTARLHQRIVLIRATHRAMNADPFKGWALAAKSYMAKIGRPDLAPTTVFLKHPFKDRHTGEMVDRTIERDESQHLTLWANRLRATLFRECVNEIPKPQQPGTTQPDDPWKKGSDLLGGFAA